MHKKQSIIAPVQFREKKNPMSQSIRNYEQIAFLHLVSDVEEFRYDTDVPTFVLSDLVSKYDKILWNILPEELRPPSNLLVRKPHGNDGMHSKKHLTI